MKLTTPAFGLMSGVGASLGLLPHVINLCILLSLGTQLNSIASLVVLTIGAKLLGEWIFWRLCISRLNSEKELKNWRSVINNSLFSQPNAVVALVMMFVDAFLDAALIFMAFKTVLPALWIFLVLLSCQMISSPIQGVLPDYFSQRKSLIFASAAGLFAWTLTGAHLKNIGEYSTKMICILCIKGLLGNLTVIARAAIAEVIKFETLRNSKPKKA